MPGNEGCMSRRLSVTVVAVLTAFVVFAGVWKISKMLSPWKGCDSEESVVREFDGIRQEAEI